MPIVETTEVGFSSKLILYKTQAFQQPQRFLNFVEGERIYVQHQLTSAYLLPLRLEIDNVFLSASANRSDTDSMKHKLSPQVWLEDRGTGRKRFSVTVLQCERCFLHVASSLHDVPAGRRLQASVMSGPSHDAQSFAVVGINIKGAEVDTGNQLVFPAAVGTGNQLVFSFWVLLCCSGIWLGCEQN